MRINPVSDSHRDGGRVELNGYVSTPNSYVGTRLTALRWFPFGKAQGVNHNEEPQ